MKTTARTMTSPIKQTATRLTMLVALFAAIHTKPVHAQDEVLYGKYEKGTYQITDNSLRLFAFHYRGPIDFQTAQNHFVQVRDRLNRENITHEYKDGNGNFNELNLGPDKVMVIGWFNVNSGEYGWMATRPAAQEVLLGNNTRLTNTGWRRYPMKTNGWNTYMQFGNYRGHIQYCVGFDF